MSQKSPGQDKKQRTRKRASKQTLTRAVTHIRLSEANSGKLEALDQLIAVYLPLCQQYVSLFCTQEAEPDKFADPVFETVLSDRLHRAVIQQATGIARSWRSNRQAAYDAYLEALADWKQAQEQKPDPERKEPQWREWKLPELRAPCIQANANIVVVEKSEDSIFDYWLRISTLDKGHPLHVPVKLAAYHRQAIEGKMLNKSTTLHKRHGVWWLTLSFDETFRFKQNHQPRVWASMWASPILSQPRRENSTGVFLAHLPAVTSATGKSAAVRPGYGLACKRRESKHCLPRAAPRASAWAAMCGKRSTARSI